jgi:hypothetical protein
LKDEHGHHIKKWQMLDKTGASQVLFEIFCVSYLFLNIHSIIYEINKIKTQEYCMLESFIKQKGQLGYTCIVLGRHMLYLLNTYILLF